MGADEEQTKTRVAPRRGAWIETHQRLGGPHPARGSHPAGVRGLKHYFTGLGKAIIKSHPAGVRGLKPHIEQELTIAKMSHPAGVRGLKRSSHHSMPTRHESHPVRVRGLKHVDDEL